MKTDQARIKWEGMFSIIQPEGWTYIQEQDVIGLFNETHGVGSLQISFALRHKEGTANLQEAIKLTELYVVDRKWSIDKNNIHQLEINGYPATEITFVEDGGKSRFWHVWHIVSNKRVAFITYNCESDEANLESAEIITIVQSFKWEL